MQKNSRPGSAGCYYIKAPPMAVLFPLYRREDKILGQSVAGGENGDTSVGTGVHGKGDLFSPEHLFDIGYRIVGLHFVKKYIPHLIIGAKILNFPHQFIFCYGEPLLFVRISQRKERNKKDAPNCDKMYVCQ